MTYANVYARTEQVGPWILSYGAAVVNKYYHISLLTASKNRKAIINKQLTVQTPGKEETAVRAWHIQTQSKDGHVSKSLRRDRVMQPPRTARSVDLKKWRRTGTA